jgi:hypothetical protein
MLIATYNVNDINGRLSGLLAWLKEAAPDVACLQELKAPDEKFPEAAIRAAGYGAIWSGQKSWSGVAKRRAWYSPTGRCRPHSQARTRSARRWSRRMWWTAWFAVRAADAFYLRNKFPRRSKFSTPRTRSRPSRRSSSSGCAAASPAPPAPAIRLSRCHATTPGGSCRRFTSSPALGAITAAPGRFRPISRDGRISISSMRSANSGAGWPNPPASPRRPSLSASSKHWRTSMPTLRSSARLSPALAARASAASRLYAGP